MRRPRSSTASHDRWRPSGILPAAFVVLLVVVGVVIGLAVGGGRSTTFVGTSLLRAQVASEASGGDAASSAATLATASAALVDRDDIVADARTAASGVAPAAVRATARVLPGTAALEVRATDGGRDTVASVSRAFALAIRRVQTAEARDGFRRRAEALRASAAQGGGRAPAETAARVADLDSLAQTALPLAIVRTGLVSTDEPEPSDAVLAAIGAAIGLLVGLVLVWAASRWRRRGRRITDLPALRSGPVPVLGAVPPLAAFTTPESSFALGAGERELFRIVRRGLRDLVEGEPQIVLVTSAQPSAGKSTTAVGLAAIAAEAGQRVLLVECDLRIPSQAERLGLAKGPGLSDYLAGGAEPARTVQRASCGFTDQDGGATRQAAATFFVVTAGAGGSTEELDGARMDEMLGHLRRGYDLVVLDAPPLLGSADAAQLLGRADTVLVCARLGDVTWDALDAAVGVATRSGRTHVGIVATDVDRSRDPARETRVYGAVTS